MTFFILVRTIGLTSYGGIRFSHPPLPRLIATGGKTIRHNTSDFGWGPLWPSETKTPLARLGLHNTRGGGPHGGSNWGGLHVYANRSETFSPHQKGLTRRGGGRTSRSGCDATSMTALENGILDRIASTD